MDIKEYVEKFAKLMPGFIKVFHANDQEWLTDAEITISQCVVLEVLSKNDNCKMSELSDIIGVTLSNMTGMLDRLEKENFAKRVPDPSDRRVYRIKLTQKGKETVKKISSRKSKNLSAILSKLTASDRSKLLTIMEKVAKLPE